MQSPNPDLYIWHIPSTHESARLERLKALLSPAEQQRVTRLAVQTQKNTYICAKAALRSVLAQSLKCDPKSITYEYNRHGKPHLAGKQALYFNLSHTQNYSLLAVSPRHELGIDIETLKSSRDVLLIARRFFTEDESTWLAQMKPAQRTSAFYQLWCYKEAVLKATGTGLSGGLASFNTRPPVPPPKNIIDGQQRAWWLHTIDVPDSYCAALAVDAPDIIPHIKHWDINDWLS